MDQVGVGMALLVVGALLGGYSIPTVLMVRRSARIYGEPSTWMVWQQDYKLINGYCLLVGEIESAPTLTSPLGGRACVAWEVLVDEIGADAVWSTTGFGELTVSWEQTRPPGSQLPTEGGRVAVRGEVIGFPADGALTDPPDAERWHSVDLDHLARLGCPTAILDEVRAAPDRFRVTENLLTTGDHITLGQFPESKPASLPDPDLPFILGAPMDGRPRLRVSTRAMAWIGVVVFAVGLLLLVTYLPPSR